MVLVVTLVSACVLEQEQMFGLGAGRTAPYTLRFDAEKQTSWTFCWTSGPTGVGGTRKEKLPWISQHQTVQ